jgi:hypothetical protein
MSAKEIYKNEVENEINILENQKKRAEDLSIELGQKQNDLEAEIQFHEDEEDISTESMEKLNKKYLEVIDKINEVTARSQLIDVDIQNKRDELAELE